MVQTNAYVKIQEAKDSAAGKIINIKREDACLKKNVLDIYSGHSKTKSNASSESQKSKNERKQHECPNIHHLLNCITSD